MSREIEMFLQTDLYKKLSKCATSRGELTTDFMLILSEEYMKLIKELETLRKKEIPMKPLVSIVYESDNKQVRANCKACGAMVYQTCDLLPLKVAIGGERPYCQHCGQHLSDDIDLNENHYCNAV